MPGKLSRAVGVPEPRVIPQPTHLVLSGRIRYDAYLDGDEDGNDSVLRDITDGKVVAKRYRDAEGALRWNRPVARAKPPNPNAPGRGKWDNVRALPGPAVRVQLTKGRFY